MLSAWIAFLYTVRPWCFKPRPKDETFFSTYYDAIQDRISQEKHLLSGFPLSYQLTTAGRSAHQGRLAGTDLQIAQRETR